MTMIMIIIVRDNDYFGNYILEKYPLAKYLLNKNKKQVWNTQENSLLCLFQSITVLWVCAI